MAKVKPNKQNIIDEFIQLIKKGHGYSKVMGVNGGKWGLPPTTFDRYWKIASEQHIQAQQELKKKLTEVDESAAIEARKKAIMTAEERKEYLTKLITGKVQIPYTEVKWNPVTKKFETIQFVELASHAARINAISELNKMEGDYAPAKIAQTDKDGNDVTPTLIIHQVATEAEIKEIDEA